MGIILNRRRVYGGESLPYDYEVEYIQFNAAGSGKAAKLIFYGLPADGYLTVDLTLNAWGNASAYPTAFDFQVQGVTNNWAAYRTMLYQLVKEDYIQFEKGAGNNIYEIIVRSPAYPYLISRQMVKYHVKPNVDGTPAKKFSIGGGCPATYRTFKIYDLNRILVLDVIPVSVNGVGQLYDKISGKLGESLGNMDFTAGPRIS